VNFVATMAVLLFAWASPAAADLYRWVDPETGSVKFSSYPPPWFGNAEKQRRAPKVEVIPPGKSATAFEPTPNTDRDRAATSAADAPRGDRRGVLLKVLAQRVGSLVAAAPDATERAFVAISESLQELEQQEKQSKPSNLKEEAARLEEKWQLAEPLEAHRLVLTQQISGLRPPPPGATPEAVANAWRGTQLQVSALEWTNEALKAIDPRKLNARHFEMRALTEKIAEMWEPYVGRRDLGR
jgi:Domain of unknown function (DUF4124)